jgi:hypothetical protein
MALAMMALSSCSLYLSDDEVDTIRTEAGYSDVETMELPDGTGTVEYQYDEKTIAINDDVEQYVIKVESDSIVYFVDSTPDYYLPQVGEMMVCSFREKFPDAFCHRCIERKNENGIWRCVFTRCGLFDAFKVLKVNVETNERTTVVPAEGTHLLTTEEQDSLTAVMQAEDEQPAETRRGSRRVKFDDKFTEGSFMHKFPKQSLSATAGSNAAGFKWTASMEGHVIMGAHIGANIDSETNLIELGAGLYGEIRIDYEFEATREVTLSLPVAVSMAGFKIDIGIAGLEAGLTGSPYITIKRKISTKISYCWDFNADFFYSNKNNEMDESKFSVRKAYIKKKAGEQVLSISKLKDDFDGMNVEMGFDMRIGLSGHTLVSHSTAAAGVKIYGEVDFPFDDKTFHSAEEFRTSQANFITKEVFYATVGQGVIIGTEKTVQTPPIYIETFNVPLVPVAYQPGCNMRCTQHEPKVFEMEGYIQDYGLLGLLPGAGYYMKLYTSEGNELKTILLSGTDGNLRRFAATKRIDELQFNVPYIAQFAIHWGDYYIPLHNFPFEEQIADMSILSATLKYTNRGDFLKPVKGTDQVNHYAYCYTIDVMVNIEAQRLIRKWGIHSNMYSGFNEIYAAEFERTNNGIDDMDLPVVRFRWYSNKPTIMVGFYPYCYVKSQKDRTLFPAVTKTYNYDPTLEYISPSDEKPDYDAEEDSER